MLNLVFFKPVYSPTKFWQMVGRGTRLCPDIFGPGHDKQNFYIFDYCGNVEMFSGKPVTDPASARQRTLSERLFVSRSHLISLLDASPEPSHDTLRSSLATHLHELVTSVPDNDILVRPADRPVVHRFQDPSAWEKITADDVTQLTEHVAHLPFASTVKENPSAKRIDLLILQLQLALLEEDASFAKNKQRLEKTAGDLLTVELEPVRKHYDLLERITEPSWWDGVTLEGLELARKAIREIADFIPAQQRTFVDVDFEDTFGELTPIELDTANAAISVNVTRARARLQEYLSTVDSLALQKLRTARPLTAEDMKALEELLAGAGEETVEQVRESLATGDNLGLFIRRIVGLDEEAIRAEFADFLDGTTLTANQIGFLRELIAQIVEQGGVQVSDFFQPPLNTFPVLELFDASQVEDLRRRIDLINASAEVS